MRYLEALIDFLSPRACYMCGRRLTLSEKQICAVCNWQLPRTDFADSPYDNRMSRLFWGRFDMQKASAFFTYESGSDAANLIYRLKYNNVSVLGEWLGEQMAMELQEKGFFDDIDAIVPVPLTFTRRLRRGYNQSEVISEGIRNVTRLPILKNVLKRTRFDGSQTHLGAQERRENVNGVFQLVKPDKVAGKHILLVDDVVTTGATTGACGEELAKAGDVKISVVAIGCAKL